MLTHMFCPSFFSHSHINKVTGAFTHTHNRIHSCTLLYAYLLTQTHTHSLAHSPSIRMRRFICHADRPDMWMMLIPNERKEG